MKIYDTSNRMADVTPENVHEFIDWWLFRKAYEALHFAVLNGQLELQEAVKIIVAQNNISVVLVPVILTKAEHIKVLCESDADLHEFVWDGRNASADNPYVLQYGADRFWAATDGEDMVFEDLLPSDPSLIIDGDSLEIPYEVRSPDDDA